MNLITFEWGLPRDLFYTDFVSTPPLPFFARGPISWDLMQQGSPSKLISATKLYTVFSIIKVDNANTIRNVD
ncbi:MAG: hypothetical protein KatS3mg023_3988 [Armatimonadota bacterium]|nr:MAG: hypothetical protein KatS3mg023_3988 [Armatimonadota bacterium]